MRLTCSPLVLASMAAAGIVCVAAARAEAQSDEKRDVASVRAAAKEYLSAIHRGDRDAVRNSWTPDGEYIDAAGKTFQVREMLSNAGSEVPRSADEGSSPMPESKLRFVAPDVAVEDGVWTGGLTDDGGALTGRFTMIWVKRDGRWQIDSLREAVSASPSGKDQLRALEWLIGEWVGVTESGAILVSSQWSDDGHYIIRQFAELTGGPEAICSTQRIGWDAAAGKIKSWTFDSQGGFAEGIWRHDGKKWIVEMAEVMPDGKTAKMSAAYLPGEAGRFVWEAAGGKVAGENVPSRRVEFSRATE